MKAHHDRDVHNSPSPPLMYDEQVASTQSPTSLMEDGNRSSVPRSSSPQAGTQQDHTMDNDSDSDVDINISKTPNIEKKSTRPKAGDYHDSEKELVLAAANIYRVLLASRGSFPNTAMEVKLIKKAWKLMNEESGQKARALSPSIITIVSIFITDYTILLGLLSRLRLEGPSFEVRLKRRQLPWWRRFTALTVDAANARLVRTGKLRRH